MTIRGPSDPDAALATKTALVSGASSGIGRSISLALGASGAHVVLLGRRGDRLKKVADEVEAAGGRANTLVCDVTNFEEMDQSLGELSGLDILVNCAGMNIPRAFDAVTPAEFDAIFDLNIRSLFFLSQGAVRLMAPSKGGAIINISSQMGHVGAANRTVYCASKHAIEGLTKAMAVELGPKNIRVNSVCPTFIETPMTQAMFEQAEFRQEVVSKIPLGRVGQPEDIAAMVTFLASGSASMITGAGILIDGGWTAQ